MYSGNHESLTRTRTDRFCKIYRTTEREKKTSFAVSIYGGEVKLLFVAVFTCCWEVKFGWTFALAHMLPTLVCWISKVLICPFPGWWWPVCWLTDTQESCTSSGTMTLPPSTERPRTPPLPHLNPSQSHKVPKRTGSVLPVGLSVLHRCCFGGGVRQGGASVARVGLWGVIQG